MVAASGNAGPKSPPLYPAADADVIAVSATDVDDRLFAASNRGGHIAVAAPGVDIFLPAPGSKYQMTSGTSFSAAYVSGLAALILERNPALKPADVRAILTTSARDLGAPGRDDLFGAGEHGYACG
jgi:subtilisin family serine protease